MLLLFALAIISYPLVRAIYNVTFHPLARYPGPKLYAAFQFSSLYRVVKGDLPKKVKSLHDTYGSVVRIAPNELSFISAQAWRDIYGARNPQIPKDYLVLAPQDEYTGKRMVVEPSDTKHHAMRHQIGHAFAPRALLEIQPLISSYIDKLVSNIRDKASSSKGIDISAHFNWTTFDIIGHLTFGESFHCLDTSTTHPWIQVVFDSVAVGHLLNQLARYHIRDALISLAPRSMRKPRDDMIAYSNAQMDARIQQGFGEGIPKDIAYFMRNGPDRRTDSIKDPSIQIMDRDTMCANTETLIIAGSETTATLLTGMTFLLLTKRPDILAKLQHEVRDAFPSDALTDMNFKTVTDRLPLLTATINETLRFYPPAPSALPRLTTTPRGIDGNLVPRGTTVGIWQWAANHSAQNWHRPESFAPERWLPPNPGSPFAHDQRDSCQPFSLGPRNCLGKSLAELESRLIYARILYNFDLELVDGQDDWMTKQTQSLLWDKGPLMVRVRNVKRDT